ncbi:GerMN domain-containing protein [Streptomyces sp. NPDC018031]|uniref:GerMN domain-containing protein n=1 Tax=Streptomyces sp. NPDC018031 TaxID=3365033 RepID=UPI0037AC5893
MLVALSAALLAGCGVPSTGVLDGGRAAGGLTRNLRLYFVSPAGRLEAVSRPEVPASKVTDPRGVIKLLMAGPTEAERASGLTTSVTPDGPYETTVGPDTVTVDVPRQELSASSPGDRNLAGQLVCSIARARTMADGGGTRQTDDIRVTVRARSGRPATHVCSDFLG